MLARIVQTTVLEQQFLQQAFLDECKTGFFKLDENTPDSVHLSGKRTKTH